MRISYNWLKEYLDVNLPETELADLLTDIGLEVEGIAHYESIKGGLEGIVVGHVETVSQHPDADKLKVTTVNIGLEEHLQIVCGAPNVAVGQKVPIATVGSTLYSPTGESFKIKKAKLRGVASHGMICAEDELGLGDNHDGIMILAEQLQPGLALNEVIKVEKDIIFEIGLTPNRSDAFHHIGVARDLRAVLNFRDQANVTLKLPDVDSFKADKESQLTIKIENVDACPRYSGVVIENIKVAPSPTWLQNRLNAIGQRPINNIVDITNYIMHEYGQPLHAFDMKIVDTEINVKNLADQAKFVTLDEEERKLSSEDLMICNAKEGMCIAGVFGGLHSGVSDHTTSIFLESAYFDPRSIRRSSTRHGLRTDAAIHFEKGIDPEITVIALKRAALMISEIAGGKIASQLYDIQNKSFDPFEVKFKYAQLNKLAGVQISSEAVKSIFGLLDIAIVAENSEGLSVQVPTYRADVKREADLIEEVMRIYGFNNIPIPSKINASINTSGELTDDQLYHKIAQQLVAIGGFEIMVNSISKEKYYSDKNQVKLLNNLNAELTILRSSMVFGGLEVIKHNSNHRMPNGHFFELGKVYANNEKGYLETEKLSIWLSGQSSSGNWLDKGKKMDHFYLKTIVENVLRVCGLANFKEKSTKNELFDYGQTYEVQKKSVVSFGLLTNKIKNKVEVKQDVFYAEFDWNILLDLTRKAAINFKGLPKYPSIKRDLALLVDKETSFKKIKGIGRQYGKEILREIDLFDNYQDKKMDANKKSYAISFIFRDDHKTLSDKEVDKIMNKLMEVYKNELKAVIR